MNALVYIVMFGWIPVVLFMFMCMPPRRAVIAAFLLALLFLPIAEFKLASGIPLYNKMTATSVAIVLGALFFDSKRWISFRPHWIDLPMLVWSLVPMCSAVTNDLGVYDGFAAITLQTILWGVPYLIGRVYFRTLADCRELVIGMFIGGLVYCPLCLWEVRMSPQLHAIVYGYHQHDFAQTLRFNGWRPMVFMQHGLMVGLWMVATALMGWWLWMTGALRKLGPVPMGWVALFMLVTSVLCKSTGAVALLVSGMAALMLVYLARPATVRGRLNAAPRRAAMWGVVGLWCLIVASPLYMALRFTGEFNGDTVLEISTSLGAADRAQSMETRFDSENAFIRAGWTKPLFGWRSWVRSRAVWGAHQLPIPDGLWGMALSENGLVGLTALTLTLLLPLIVLLWRYPGANWADPSVAPLIVLSVVLALYMIDNLMNAMVNPVYAVASGAIASIAALPVRRAMPKQRKEDAAAGVASGVRPALR